MKERPILFSGPMVRAILDGRKTQTRRVMKPQPEYRENKSLPGHFGTWFHDWNLDHDAVTIDDIIKYCPFGRPSDRLWVRETFVVDYEVGEGTRGGIPPAVFYRATDDGKTNFTPGMEHWKPSIHMPRMYCRLLLEVTGVRVERLQDINEDGCKAEGLDWDSGDFLGPKAQFAIFWNSLNEKRGHGWDTNPWVWVVEFERANG